MDWEYRVGDRVITYECDGSSRSGIVVRASLRGKNISLRTVSVLADGDSSRSPYFLDEICPTTTTMLLKELRDG